MAMALSKAASRRGVAGAAATRARVKTTAPGLAARLSGRSHYSLLAAAATGAARRAAAHDTGGMMWRRRARVGAALHSAALA